MKILVVHASAGAGHQKCAEGVFNYFKNHRKDVSVTLVDLLDHSSGLFRFVYRHGYTWVVNHVPWLWGFFYWATYYPPLCHFFHWLNSRVDLFTNRGLRDLFCRENPDYIISPHFLPPEVAGYLKKKKKISSKIITVITDLGIHPYWITEGTDAYVVHSDFASRQLQARGVAKERIRVSGIPVDDKFLGVYSRREVADRLCLDPDTFTVLLATGSFGLGPIEQLVDLLHTEAQIIVVCGRNQRLYQRLSEKKYAEVRVFGFTDTMHELMSCADIMLTKAGGLSVTECLAMKLVPLFIAAIPGQETQNIKVVVSGNAGIDIRHLAPRRIKDLVIDLKNNPQKLVALRNNMAILRKPSAAGDLADAVC